MPSVSRAGSFRRASSRLQASLSDKRIVFIRHGCTFMNEYLGRPGKSYGSPNFSDIFPDTEEYTTKYRDSILSPRGIGQAKSLAKRLVPTNGWGATLALRLMNKEFLNDLDLVVVSPLTRALETMKLGLLPAIRSEKKRQEKDIPIVALPEAAERLYLISDIGTPRTELQARYGAFVDFETGFLRDGQLDEEWWFRLDDNERATYKEWRPNDRNQQYACPGEPEEQFQSRMRRLYYWLRDRPESTIAVVCHWGVIDWMLGVDFENCELRVVPFDEIKPTDLATYKETSTS